MILHGLDIVEYHDAPHVSSSKLSTFIHRGPRAYWARHVVRSGEDKRKPQYDVGQAFEDAVCGRPRHVFPPADLKVAINGALTTVEAKAWKAEQQAAGLLVLGNDQRDLFEWGIKHLHANKTAMALIEASTEQVTIRAPIPGANEAKAPGMQARPDWLCLGGCPESDWAPCAPDLKTVTDLSMFASHTRRFGYFRQAGMVDLCLADDDVTGVRHPLIVVEKCFPYRCQVMWLSPDYVRAGVVECRTHLNRLVEHYESGEWPAVVEDECVLDVPGYLAVSDEDDDGEGAEL